MNLKKRTYFFIILILIFSYILITFNIEKKLEINAETFDTPITASEPTEPYMNIVIEEPAEQKVSEDSITVEQSYNDVKTYEEKAIDISEDEKDVEQSYLGSYRITGYDTCSNCCGSSTGITASGEKAIAWYTCAASKDIPFGTKLYIEGLGNFCVQDRGGFGKNTIDICVNDHEEAYGITGTYDVYIVNN